MASGPHIRNLAAHDPAGHNRESFRARSTLSARIRLFASEAGFDLCGIAPVRDFAELKIFPSWIADGRHGEMKYMEARNQAGDLKRAKLANAAPWARSVIVCAVNYNTAQPYSTQLDPAIHQDAGWISRYAWCREDYHDAILRRLRTLESRLHELWNAPDDRRPPAADALQTRAYVDTGPLIERVYAKYAGIGWIAKNTCVINQKLGSWLFLGVILTSLEVSARVSARVSAEASARVSVQASAGVSAPESAAEVSAAEVSAAEVSEEASAQLTADLPAPDRCGTCTRCIAACPTQAIVAPGELDARLCISYLTIEKRGAIPEELRAPMGRHVFGCDICQDVCPWNRKAPATTAPEFQPRAGLVTPGLEWLANMQPEEFRATFRGSPVRRAKLSGLRRNAAIAMGNSGENKFLPTLKALAQDPDPVVAEHAKWALDRKFAESPASEEANVLPPGP